jgi:hypothetical protein
VSVRLPCWLVRLLRRRSADEPSEDGSDESRQGRAGHAPGGAPGKGRPTPRRSEAQRKRTGPVPPPPRNRKEALRRQQELRAKARAEARAGRARPTDDSALPRRDKGPERALVRNLVDSRRNAGSAFLVVAVLVLVSYAVPSQIFKATVLYLWIGVFALIIFDGVLVGMRVGRLMRERFPDTKQRTLSLVLYGMNRTILPRRWRLPKPQVNLGDSI